MVLNPTTLRKNLYRFLDQVLETGEPVEIERKGRRLKIVPVEPVSRIARLEPHPDAITGDPDDLVDIEWSDAWEPSI